MPLPLLIARCTPEPPVPVEKPVVEVPALCGGHGRQPCCMPASELMWAAIESRLLTLCRLGAGLAGCCAEWPPAWACVGQSMERKKGCAVTRDAPTSLG